MSQSYQSWSLDQEISGRQPSVRNFVAQVLHLPSLSETTGYSNANEDPGLAMEAAYRKSATRTKHPVNRRKLPADSLIGRIEVPRLGLRAVVREGVGTNILDRAVGHLPSTVLPGELGNTALAAHRDTLFRRLKDIHENDLITVRTLRGQYDYRVESTVIVHPYDVDVLKPLNPDDQTLTLITCYPFNYIGSAPERFVVRARQVIDPATAQTPQVAVSRQKGS